MRPLESDVDEAALIDFLSDLDGASYAKVVSLVNAGKPYDTPELPVPQRVLRLLSYVQGAAGPGMGSVVSAVGRSFPKQFAKLMVNATDDVWIRTAVAKIASESPVRQQSLERMVNGAHGFQNPLVWTQRLSAALHCVCRIRSPGSGFGTGFLVGPDVVLTNYHVIEPFIKDTVLSKKVEFLFDDVTIPGAQTFPGTSYNLLADNWLLDQSPYDPADDNGAPVHPPDPNNLDYALVRLASEAGNLPTNVLPDGTITATALSRRWLSLLSLPTNWPSARDSPLVILQHPSGNPLSMAFESNADLQVNANGTRVRYNVNTEGGSSGSPCFSGDLQLVALHHAGDPNFMRMAQYNQGIPLSKIVQRMQGNPVVWAAVSIPLPP